MNIKIDITDPEIIQRIIPHPLACCLEEYSFQIQGHQFIRDKCIICGYKGAIDNHHVIAKKEGGKDDRNLVSLCPNCHRLVHKGKIKIYHYPLTPTP